MDVTAGLIVDSSMESKSIHNPVMESFLPVIRTWPRICTVQSIVVNVMPYIASHSFTADKSEYAANPGMMCPLLALAGSCGSASVQV